MKVNKTKTNFMVICGSDADRLPMIVDGLVVNHCQRYTYLGSPFTADGSASSAVKAHAQDKMAHFNKFVSFLHKNNDVPFIVKKRVFDAVVLSAVLYGSTTVWLVGQPNPDPILGAKLPSRGDVLKRAFYFHNVERKPSPTSAAATVQEVLRFWETARIPTMTAKSAVRKVKVLFKTGRRS
ncbi:hypothetical protein GWK47_025772 [Chionoecetes opilio]|uniref:Uncharacterized protein n=1 Tax=Chionoecetes opilio TaxID=41210 RepID=A0A8J8WAW7_CHIOP|nr:hypothetical protein GWK47_025772 [Chionoecetes opilio]